MGSLGYHVFASIAKHKVLTSGKPKFPDQRVLLLRVPPIAL